MTASKMHGWHHRGAPDGRPDVVKSFLLRLPIALTCSSALVVAGSVLATTPAATGHWGSTVGSALALFTAMVWSGAALRRRRQRRP